MNPGWADDRFPIFSIYHKLNQTLSTMKQLIPIILLASFAFTGCKQLVMWRYGIHEPRKETPESIQKFLAKHDFPDENIFIFRDSSSYSHYLSDSLYRSNLLGTLFYSPRGLLDTFKDTSRCQWSGGYFVGLLKKDTIYHADTTRTFSGLMGQLIPLSAMTSVDTAGITFFAVVTWATFLGKYNERLFLILKAIREQQEVKVIPVFLNLDMQERWNLSHSQGLEFRDD